MGQDNYKEMREAISSTVELMQKLVTKLQQNAARKKELREMSGSGPECQVLHLPQAISDPPDTLLKISERLELSDNYHHFTINDLLPDDRKIRHQVVQKLKSCGLRSLCMLLSCTQRGSSVNLHFMWKVPSDCAVDSDELHSVVERVKSEIPKHHTAIIRGSFIKQAALLNVKPMFARALFKIATGDAGASSNSTITDVDRRLLEFLETGDPEIITDLRTIRDNPSSYEDFFDLTSTMIEETVGTAVDDRRHTTVVHMATAMSGAELYRLVGSTFNRHYHLISRQFGLVLILQLLLNCTFRNTNQCIIL